jgi:hypothetical protein
MEIFAAKKKIEASATNCAHTSSIPTARAGWEELLRTEAAVRKRKQATDHRKAEIKEMLITVVIVGLVLAAGVAGLALLAYLLWASQQ